MLRFHLARGLCLGLILLGLPASASAYEYIVTDLGIPLGAFESLATGINSAGEVVGWSGNSSGGPFFRGWKWTPTTGLVVLPDFPGDDNSVPTDINDSGVIAGDGSFSGTGGLGWRFENGSYSLLPMLPGDTWSIVTGLNSESAVAGFSDDFTPAGLTEEYFFHDDKTGLVFVPENPGQITNTGRVNDAGQVAGTMSGVGPFRWTADGGFDFLAPPWPPFSSAMAWGINDAGYVCGTLFENTGGNSSNKYGAVYTNGLGWRPIADFALPGCCSNARPERAEAVNASGVVVGWSATSGGDISGSHVAWVWTAGTGARRLEDLVDPTLNLHFRKALDINDVGQIVAYGSDDDLPDPYRAFLLTPAAATGVASESVPGASESLRLSAPRPNPTRGSVRLHYSLPARGLAEVAIFDLSGRLVRRVVLSEQAAGEHFAEWDGRTDEGAVAGTGVYTARLDVGGAQLARKITLIK